MNTGNSIIYRSFLLFKMALHFLYRVRVSYVLQPISVVRSEFNGLYFSVMEESMMIFYIYLIPFKSENGFIVFNGFDYTREM